MDKFINYFKENKLFVGITTITLLSLGLIMIFSLKGTYSVSDKYVVFRGVGQHDDEIIKSCKIGPNGKLASSCVDEIARICSAWSKWKYTGIVHYDDDGNFKSCQRNDNGNGISPTTLKTMTFSDNDTYYCVGCTSVGLEYFWGCYVCDNHPEIMTWVVNINPKDTSSASSCPSNSWHKDRSITDDKQCPPPTYACYECKDDKTIVDWRTSGDSDNSCTGGYKKLEGITEANCKYVAPPSSSAPTYACYECKTDKTIVDWRTSDAKDNQCSAGYKKLEGITEANCKYVAPPSSSAPTYACYECKTDKTIVDWRTSDAGDNSCTGGYKKLEGITEANCKYVAPPSSSPKSTYACYECKADKNIMRWKENALGDNMCPGGYNKTVKTKDQCNVDIPVNPPTGQTRYIITIIMASIAIGCSLWYLKKSV